MKKRRNFAAAILLASMMAVSTCAATALTASAADVNRSVTLSDTPVTNDTATHSYVAYRIFKADLATIEGVKQLVSIDWADGVKGPAIIAALKAETAFGAGAENKFYNCDTAAKVASKLEVFKDNSAEAYAFARVLDSVLADGASNLGTGITLGSNAVPGPGYYFVKDNATAPSSGTQYAVSAHILKVLQDEDLTVTPKASVPTIDKKIDGGEDNGHANTASIGDTVPYTITTAMPDLRGYEKYFFVINDTMEPGLTFNASSVAVKIGSTTLTAGTDYELQTDGAADGHTFQIVFKDFVERTEVAGTEITVTYNATVNNDATAGGEVADANTNTVNLTFSNNPNIKSDGKSTTEPDEPDSDDPVGKTPDHTTYTYLTEIEILKVDATDNTKMLGGATFQLTGTSLQAVTTSGGAYKKNASVAAENAWYLLKDGTYTQTAPTGETTSKYASPDKYELVEDIDTVTSMNKVNAYGTTSDTDPNKGTVKFGKLGAGAYTLKETAAPTGYNPLASPINVTITAAPTSAGCTWGVTGDGAVIDGNVVKVTVQNNKGTTLPSTGGIGTTIFYVVGGTLVAGAVVMLITKKRMSVSDQK